MEVFYRWQYDFKLVIYLAKVEIISEPKLHLGRSISKTLRTPPLSYCITNRVQVATFAAKQKNFLVEVFYQWQYAFKLAVYLAKVEIIVIFSSLPKLHLGRSIPEVLRPPPFTYCIANRVQVATFAAKQRTFWQRSSMGGIGLQTRHNYINPKLKQFFQVNLCSKEGKF